MVSCVGWKVFTNWENWEFSHLHNIYLNFEFIHCSEQFFFCSPDTDLGKWNEFQWKRYIFTLLFLTRCSLPSSSSNRQMVFIAYRCWCYFFFLSLFCSSYFIYYSNVMIWCYFWPKLFYINEHLIQQTDIIVFCYVRNILIDLIPPEESDRKR